MENIKNFSWSNYDFILDKSIDIVFGIIFLIFGIWIIKKSIRGLENLLNKKNIDPSLISFLKSFLSIALQIALIISVLSMIGVEMTSFLAILGAAGLAIGLALKDTLQNFAAGVMILFFKPFKVGDWIEFGGMAGTVKEIQIFNTILTTIENKRVIIPNGLLQSSSLTNFSTEDKRRIQWIFCIAYGDDYDLAKKLLSEWIKEDSRILDEKESSIVLSELADSSVNIRVRVWVRKSDFQPVKFDFNEKVYKEFPKNGLNLPFPQLDVHLNN